MTVTWNPADKASTITLSGGNLTYTQTAVAPYEQKGVRATLSHSTGKWYYELVHTTLTSPDMARIGLSTSAYVLTTALGAASNGWSYLSDARKYHSGSATAYGNTYAAGDVIGVAVDLDSGKVWFSKNGTWQNSGDPVTEANPAFTDATGTLYPTVAAYSNATGITNVGIGRFTSAAFSYAPPTGFVGWEDVPTVSMYASAALIPGTSFVGTLTLTSGLAGTVGPFTEAAVGHLRGCHVDCASTCDMVGYLVGNLTFKKAIAGIVQGELTALASMTGIYPARCEGWVYGELTATANLLQCPIAGTVYGELSLSGEMRQIATLIGRAVYDLFASAYLQRQQAHGVVSFNVAAPTSGATYTRAAYRSGASFSPVTTYITPYFDALGGYMASCGATSFLHMQAATQYNDTVTGYVAPEIVTNYVALPGNMLGHYRAVTSSDASGHVFDFNLEIPTEYNAWGYMSRATLYCAASQHILDGAALGGYRPLTYFKSELACVGATPARYGGVGYGIINTEFTPIYSSSGASFTCSATLHGYITVSTSVYEILYAMAVVLTGVKLNPSIFVNYELNSFATVDGLHYAAGTDGIYLLEGDRDDGDTIRTCAVISENAYGSNRRKRPRAMRMGPSADDARVNIITENKEKEYRQNDEHVVLSDRHHYGKKIEYQIKDFEELKEIELLIDQFTK